MFVGFCFLDHGMSYLQRWRKIPSEEGAITLENSIEDDGPENLDRNQRDVQDEVEDVVLEGSSTLQEASEPVDTNTDSDF